MFRVNRIGEHMLVDCEGSPVSIDILTANFGTTARANTTGFDYAVQTDLATTPDFFSVSAHKPVAQSWVLNAGQSWSFGRFLDATMLNNDGLHINLAGSFYINAIDNDEFDTAFYLARLASGSPTVDYTAEVNVVDGAMRIPARYNDRTEAQHGDCACQVVEGLYGNTVSDRTQQALAFFVSMRNLSGSNRTIHEFQCSLSAWAYRGDLLTHDPVR
jgi:hypothetical protein